MSASSIFSRSQATPNAPRRQFPIKEFLDRTVRLLGEDAVHSFRTRTVAIAGCGGVGGAAAVTLARMGFQRFVLADPGRFDPPDANRQWGAYRSTFERNKAEVYAELLRDINPGIEVLTYSDGVTPANVKTILNGADVLVDCMDMDVPPALRLALYGEADRRQIFAIVAPILGFGALVVAARPGGVPLAEFGRVMSDAISNCTLPLQLFRHFVPAHLMALGHSMKELKAPSVAVSPVVATGVVCTEIALHVLGPHVPGGRAPVTLPEMIAVDLFKGRMELVELSALEHGSAGAIAPPASRELRGEVLAGCKHNAALVPAGLAEVDLSTDSWLERDGEELPAAPDVDGALETELTGWSGFTQVVPVHQGRAAEAVLAGALLARGGMVLCNSLFATTRHHIEARGTRLVDVTTERGGAFGGDLDIEQLSAALKTGDAQAVWIDLCNNGLGGQPVSLDNLRQVRELTGAHQVPLVLDASRAMTNAVLIARREPAERGRAPREILQELFSLADASASSLSKDFVARGGGWIGVRDPELFYQARDLALLGLGDGLDQRRRAALARAVRHARPEASVARVDTVEALGAALLGLGVPLAAAPGGHALLVDAGALYARLDAELHPAQALVNALYLEGGVKADRHLLTERQASAGMQLVRLAVPVGGLSPQQQATVADTFERLLQRRDREPGLRRVGDAGGRLGQFAAYYTPLTKNHPTCRPIVANSACSRRTRRARRSSTASAAPAASGGRWTPTPRSRPASSVRTTWKRRCPRPAAAAPSMTASSPFPAARTASGCCTAW